VPENGGVIVRRFGGGGLNNPYGDPQNRFAYTMVDLKDAFNAETGATLAESHFLHFKSRNAADPDYVLLFDEAATSAGRTIRRYTHYPNSGEPGEGATTLDTASQTATSRAASEASVLSKWMAPGGAGSFHLNSTYQPPLSGFGSSFRVDACASAGGSSCNSSATSFSLLSVHKILGDTTSGHSTFQPSAIPADPGWHAVEVKDANPVCWVHGLGGTQRKAVKFTTTYGGAGRCLIDGLKPGTYTLKRNGSELLSGIVVAGGDNSIYYESGAGQMELVQNVAVRIQMTPALAKLDDGQSQQFIVNVTGSANTAVSWSYVPRKGTLAPVVGGARYTAPSTIPLGDKVTITACSEADPEECASAVVTLDGPELAPFAVWGTGLAGGASTAGVGVAAGTGVTAGDGGADPNYRLVSSADNRFTGPAAMVVNSGVFPVVAPYWMANGPNSKWIAPRPDAGNSNAPGSYTYRTTFDLTGWNLATAQLTGKWACDDTCVMKLNGTTVATISTIGTFSKLAPFTVFSGFTAGINTLDFVVTNNGSVPNPTGLRVEIAGTAGLLDGVSVSVAVSPSTATLSANQQQQFTATVTGSTNTAVTWSIQPAGAGSVSASGLYTAPASIASQTVVQVIATRVADPSKTASAAITLNPPAALPPPTGPPPPTTGPQPIPVFHTGVTDAGGLASDGAIDSHYTLVSSPDDTFTGPSTRVVNSNAYPIPIWVTNGPTSKWIAPQANQGTGNAAGTYTYRTTFQLTGLDPTTATLSGRWACDNTSVMRLNGVIVSGVNCGLFTSFTPFTINKGFVAGLNTLEFLLTNAGWGVNPTGLRVEISGTASPLNPPVTVTSDIRTMSATAAGLASSARPATDPATEASNAAPPRDPSRPALRTAAPDPPLMETSAAAIVTRAAAIHFEDTGQGCSVVFRGGNSGKYSARVTCGASRNGMGVTLTAIPGAAPGQAVSAPCGGGCTFDVPAMSEQLLFIERSPRSGPGEGTVRMTPLR
jgi:hypothetical protein